MIYGSVCSGIEAATVAWHPLGWKAAWYSEIEAFPSAVLQHHYPETPNLGDMTRLYDKPEFRERSIDLLVGGTPCQSFSVAGLRKGLADPRGNLALVFLGILERARPKWVVWENVPGVLSSAGGRDFGAFLGGLAQLGYGWAYRVLDAQYFGVPQRRRRVFVVGHLGDWRLAAAVLFERHSLSGDSAPSREKGASPTDGPGKCIEARGGSGRGDPTAENYIVNTTHALTHRYDSSEDGCGRGTPLVAACLTASPSTVRSPNEDATLVFSLMPQNSGKDFKARQVDLTQPIMAAGQTHGNQGGDVIKTGMTVRRLTPRECERLQGFPDDYTLIPVRGKPAADGPRYKALGNSMAVPVMRWIGERIQMVVDMGAHRGEG